MMIEAEAAENVVRGRLAEPSGTVRITASVPTAQLSLAPLLPQLALAYPKLRVTLHATDRFVDVIQDGFDLAVRDHFAPLPDSGLVQRRIGFQAKLIVASPLYLQGNGTPERPEDLDHHDGLLTSLASEGWVMERADGSTVSVSPRPRFVADESRVLREAARGSRHHHLARQALSAGDRKRHAYPHSSRVDRRQGDDDDLDAAPARAASSVRATVDFIAERLVDG